MNIISKLRSKQKMLIIAGALLFGLALTPTVSIAANAEHEGYRNNDVHNANKQQGNRHAEKNIKHQNNGHHNKHVYADRRYHAPQGHHRHNHNKHAYADRRYHAPQGHHRHNHNKHRNHYHRKPHYAVNNHHHHHPDRFGFQIGVHTGNFDIIVRD